MILNGIFLLISLISYSSLGQVSGTVFRDFNGNGTRDAEEPLIPGVTVKVYNTATGSGILCGSAVTSGNTSPNYSLAGCGTVDVRVEFVMPTSGRCANDSIDYNALSGITYGSSVQFVKGNSTNVNFAIYNPGDYNKGSANTMVYVPCYVHGDPLVATGASGNSDWFVGYPYNNSGTTTPSKKLKGFLIGTTWGVAYSRIAKKIFTSAMMKRHTGLGQMGTGGIYIIDETTFLADSLYNLDKNGYRTRAAATAPVYGAATFSLTTQTIGGVTGTGVSVSYLGTNDVTSGQPEGLGVIGTNVQRGLTGTPTSPTYDPAAFDQVGKVGLGDLEISEDEKYLFVVNLYSRKVLRMKFDNPANPTTFTEIKEYTLPAVTVTNGILRPWGLKFFRGKLYVGAVSTGENGGSITINGASDVNAYVFEVADPTGNFTFNSTPVLNYPLNYTKGSTASGSGDNRWYPWTSKASDIIWNGGYNLTYPQPILSDIEFSDRGDMILSFMDRAGNQLGANNYRYLSANTEIRYGTSGGDIQVAGLNCTTNTFKLENNGQFNSINGETYTGGWYNAQGPGGGEFFNADAFSIHSETAMGGLAMLKGDGNIMTTIMDPDAFLTGGTVKFSTTNAGASGNYRLYGDGSVPGTTTPTLGKAIGLGDIELSGVFAPIEIGNRVWSDTDRDGIQDAGELGLSNIKVVLCTAAGVKTDSVITDVNGNYYFSSATGTNTSSVKYGLSLLPNTNYILKFPTTSGINYLTSTKAGTSDLIDSDAAANGQIAFKAGNVGSVNHRFDVGYVCTAPLVTASVYTKATCPATGITANNTASIKITTNGDKAALSITGTPTTLYASATAVTAGNITFSALNGLADSLYVRIFKGANCYIDTIFVVKPARCCPAITFGTPTSNTAYCSGATIASVAITTNAISPDSIRFVMFNTKKTTYNEIINGGGTLLGEVKITGTATTVTNTASLANVVLPAYFGAANDTLYIYAVYIDKTGDTTCKVFAEKPIILKPEPVANITGFSTACNSTAITLSSDAATTYKWGKVGSATVLATTQTYVVTPPINATSTYWLLTTNAGTCVSDTAKHSITAGTGIFGTVFKDYNLDGVTGTSETSGLIGIKVRAYDCAGNLIETTTTDAQGRYLLSSVTAAMGIVRIEFDKTTLPINYTDSYAGTNNKTDVQFVTAPSCNIDWGVIDVSSYCQLNPQLMATCFVNGTANATSTPADVIVSFPYKATGAAASITKEAVKSQTGSVWGLAYGGVSKKIYSATFLKRHVGIKGNLGDIYVTDLGGASDGTVFVTIPNAGTIGTDASRDITTVTAQSIDLEGFGKVGRVGLGDIDITQDEKTLYVVNLNDKKLYTVDVASKALNSYALPVICDASKGNQVPFGIKIKNGKVYVGAVCDASISKSRNDLKAHVLEFDINTNTFNPTPVFSVDLTYTKGIAWNNTGYTSVSGSGSAAVMTNRWFPWLDTYDRNAFEVFRQSGDARDLVSHPTPILSDIEFDDKGNMILGFLDRVGHQFGEGNKRPDNAGNESAISGGDILKAYKNPTSNLWTVESTIATGGEFFKNDSYPVSLSGGDHNETSEGGIFYSFQDDMLVLSSLDPINYTSGGLIYLSNSTGLQVQAGVQLYSGGTTSGFFGKASGIGDVEAACNQAPIQIGNYIWLDADKDGVQDPCELPAVGVKVYLYQLC